MFSLVHAALAHYVSPLQLRLASSGVCSKKPSTKETPKKSNYEPRLYCGPKPNCSEWKLKSMWTPPKNLPKPYPFQHKLELSCCAPGCRKPFPRFDVMFYHPSCKDRKYQTTWVECPDFLYKKKRICCFDKLEGIKPERRGPKRQHGCPPPKTASKTKSKSKCPEMPKMKGCIRGRKPPKCHNLRRQSCCRKLCAPMPSYSECRKPTLASLYPPPPECFCPGAKPSACDILAYGEYLKRYGLKQPCASKKNAKK